MENSSIAVESSPEAETAPVSQAAESFDFQNPGHSIREGIRRLESAHEAFAARFQRVIGDSYGATVKLELQGIEQSTFKSYLSTLPTPGLLGLLQLRPFPGTVILEMSSSVGLPLIELMLGGSPDDALQRKLTILERQLLQGVAEEAVSSLDHALEPLGLEIGVNSWEADGEFIDVPMTELAILVKYGVTFGESGVPTDRLVLTYPLSALQAIAEGTFDSGDDAAEREPAHVRDHLPDVSLPFLVHLQPSRIGYSDIAELHPGDVLRLDHAIDDPVLGLVGTRPLVAGRLGTRRNKLALEIAGWIDS